jgi:predicted lipoprotein with Yx(FWY)xxD motif
MRVATTILGIAILVAVAAIASKALHPSGDAKTQAAWVVSTMPPGVTLQLSGTPDNYGRLNGPMVLADSKGLTLYTYDKDSPGKSACSGDCAKAWTPLAAPADAQASGDWTVAVRDDGSKQWAFKGKALYTSSLDSKPSETKGNGADNGAWHTALHNPAAGTPLPDGIATREETNAGGMAFIDARKKTLYVFDGDAKSDTPPCAPGATCINHWLPMIAPELANNVGDFSPVSRVDGTKQWAYRGKPLYTYDGDFEPGDSIGRDVDPKFHVALIERYFMPTNVAVKRNLRGFDMLTTADGRTLYAHDRYMYQVGGFSLKGGQKGIPAMGRAMGTLTCPTPACTDYWPPLKAPDDAKPSGYFTVVTRSDGSKQWAYGGYPLYSFVKDTKPGDAVGHDMFDISIKLPPTPSPIDAVSGLYWREVMP